MSKSKRIAIQIFSDIHLELLSKNTYSKLIKCFVPKSDYLFLAGDITNVSHPSCKEFFQYCNATWKKTFYVMGNHEYYNNKNTFHSLSSIKTDFVTFLEEQELDNIFFLDDQEAHLQDNIYVLGSTFWTKPTFTSLSDYDRLMDYKSIYIGNPCRLITPNDVLDLHSTNYCFLQNNLASNSTKQYIVMTHFPPQRTGTSHPKYTEEPYYIKEYFAHPDTTISKLISSSSSSNILSWISGHTHYSYDFINKSNNVRLISNQVGYKHELIINISGLNFDGVYII